MLVSEEALNALLQRYVMCCEFYIATLDLQNNLGNSPHYHFCPRFMEESKGTHICTYVAQVTQLVIGGYRI